MRREIMRKAINRPYIFPVGVTVPFETLTGTIGATRANLEGLWYKLNDHTARHNNWKDHGFSGPDNWFESQGRWRDGRVR